MFRLLKLIIWITGLLTISYFIMNYLGYKINYEYFQYSKKDCEKRLETCEKHLMYMGVKQAQCNLKCVNPKLFIKKRY